MTHERNSCEVPEDNQETPFLVVHIPGLGNAFLTLAAGTGGQKGRSGEKMVFLPSIQIEPCCKSHESHILEPR